MAKNQGSFLDYLGGNSFEVDAAQEEAKIRAKYPYLLHKDERVELAYKNCGGWGRDKQFLTNKRILLKDGKGIGGKRRNYLSIPYDQIQAFAVETAGKFDGDVELKLWCKGGLGHNRIDFARGIVDIFIVQHFFNQKVFGMDAALRSKIQKRQLSSQEYNQSLPNLDKIGTMESFFNFMGNDGVQLDTQAVEHQLKHVTPVLMPDERVILAFKCGRDTSVLTDTRFMDIDVQGLMGKKVEFFSMKWECVQAFAVETAGSWERDADFTLYTNIWNKKKIRQDLRKGKADLFAVQKAFSDILLGEDPHPLPERIDSMEGHQDPGAKWYVYGGSNARPLDAVEMDRLFHSYPAILQSDEVVEMAFKGRRDITLFTTKRLIDIDVKGFTGKKVEYTSVPWSSVIAFGVQTAGKYMDLDCEALIWTEIMYDPGSGEDDPDEPGMSFLELDFNKDMVDLLSIKRYLAARCLKGEIAPGVQIPTTLMAAQPTESGLERWLSKWGGDQITIDAAAINTDLHTNTPILMEDENVVMAFKAGRDITCFTNLRVIHCDTKGWSGKKVEYVSVPYQSIRAFKAESAGNWDRDSDVDLYTANHWTLSKFSMDFRKGKADIVAIKKFLSALLLDNHDDLVRFTDQTSNPIEHTSASSVGSFLDWLVDFSWEGDTEVTNAQLHSNPAILLSDEHVLKVWKENRDLWVYTNKRVLLVDVQGFSGKKVQYKSIPYQWVTGFAVETAGHLDMDAELYVYNNYPRNPKEMMSILVSKGNIFDMHEFMTQQILYPQEKK